jgi:hypothetical protein
MRYRLALAVTSFVSIVLGYSVRFAPQVPEWFRNIWGNVAYETLWVSFFLLLLPRVKPKAMAITVCLVTFGLEFLQLYQAPWIQALRKTLPGRLILGNGFTWEDFPCYVVGSAIAYLWTNWLRSRLKAA